MSSGVIVLDPLVGDLVERHRGVEGEPGEDRHLRRGVGAADVVAGVGLGVAQLLGARPAPRRRRPARRHLAEDEVGGAVDDAEDLARSRCAEALLDHPHDRDHPGDGGLEAQLDPGLARGREQLLAVLGEQLLVGGDHRAAGRAAPSSTYSRAGSVPPISSTIRSERSRISAKSPSLRVSTPADLGPPPGRGLDRVGALGEQVGEGPADRAPAQQPDADRAQTSRAVRSS